MFDTCSFFHRGKPRRSTRTPANDSSAAKGNNDDDADADVTSNGDSSSTTAAAAAAKRKYAVVCSSNVNRSVMAQIVLAQHNIVADSYGTGT